LRADLAAMTLWHIATELWIRAANIFAELRKHSMAGRFVECPIPFLDDTERR